jgi:hypothetical protein
MENRKKSGNRINLSRIGYHNQFFGESLIRTPSDQRSKSFLIYIEESIHNSNEVDHGKRLFIIDYCNIAMEDYRSLIEYLDIAFQNPHSFA